MVTQGANCTVHRLALIVIVVFHRCDSSKTFVSGNTKSHLQTHALFMSRRPITKQNKIISKLWQVCKSSCGGNQMLSAWGKKIPLLMVCSVQCRI